MFLLFATEKIVKVPISFVLMYRSSLVHRYVVNIVSIDQALGCIL